MGTAMPFYDYMSKDDINSFRKKLGLPLIRQGTRTCMCCGNLFFSEDMSRIRLCKRCKSISELQGGLPVHNMRL